MTARRQGGRHEQPHLQRTLRGLGCVVLQTTRHRRSSRGRDVSTGGAVAVVHLEPLAVPQDATHQGFSKKWPRSFDL